MSTPVVEPAEAPVRPPRMWRKLIAFRHDQKDALRAIALQRDGDEQGNVSAVVRDAVDQYIDNQGAATQ